MMSNAYWGGGQALWPPQDDHDDAGAAEKTYREISATADLRPRRGLLGMTRLRQAFAALTASARRGLLEMLEQIIQGFGEGGVGEDGVAQRGVR